MIQRKRFWQRQFEGFRFIQKENKRNNNITGIELVNGQIYILLFACFFLSYLCLLCENVVDGTRKQVSLFCRVYLIEYFFIFFCSMSNIVIP